MEQHMNRFNTLRGFCREYQPNDADFLRDNPETLEQIQEMDAIEPTSNQAILLGLELVTGFLEDWFPDEVDEDEQDEVRTALNEGYESIKELKQKVLLEETHEKLKGTYKHFMPNEEVILEDFPPVKLKMNSLVSQQPSTNEEYLVYFSNATSFMDDWFPDNLSESEQKEIRQIMDDVYKVMGELKKQIK